MKKIELTRKWWNETKPDGVRGLELEQALITIEQAEGEKSEAALNALPSAVSKVARTLDKRAHKDLLKSLDALLILADKELVRIIEERQEDARATQRDQEDSEAEEVQEKVEEIPEDQLFTAEAARRTIRRAFHMPIVFAFALQSKPEGCVLGLQARGNPARLLRLARTRSGSMRGCCGYAQADANDPKTLVLSLEGPPISGVGRAMRIYLQTIGIRLFTKLKVMVDGQRAELEAEGDEIESRSVPGSPPPPDPAPLDRDSSEPRVEPRPLPPTAAELEMLQDRRRLFKKARSAWVSIKAKAEMDLEEVKDGARRAYMADPSQFPKIVEGCKAIDDILDNLDDELRDTLDRYASTPLTNQTKLRSLAAAAETVLDRYLAYVESNTVMKAIDRREFANVTIHAPIMKALKDLRRAME